MGDRIYLPGLGRFIQPDPVEGGGANTYGYPPDPVNGRDLDGNAWFIPLIIVAVTLLFAGPTVSAPSAKKTTSPPKAPDILTVSIAIASFASPSGAAAR